jgi:hypothetical protein
VARLSTLLPLLTAALATLSIGGTPVKTVLDHIPDSPVTPDELPAIVLDVRGPSVTFGAANRRRFVWPIDFHIAASSSTATIDTSIPAIFDLGDDIIAMLDHNRTFNGVLARTVEYSDPAFSVDESGSAYGMTEPFNDTVVIGTALHAMFTLDRVGGF